MGTITHGVCDVGGLLVATVGGPGATLAPVSTSVCRRRLFNVLSKRNGRVQFIGFHHVIGQFSPFIARLALASWLRSGRSRDKRSYP